MEISTFFEIEIIYNHNNLDSKAEVNQNALNFAKSFSAEPTLSENESKTTVLCPVKLSNFLLQMRQVKAYFEEHLSLDPHQKSEYISSNELPSNSSAYIQLNFSLNIPQKMDSHFVNEGFQNLGLNIYFETFVNGFVAIFETASDLQKLGDIIRKFR
jgi:hypothetical protein